MVHDLLEKTFSLQEHIHLILRGMLAQKIHSSWIECFSRFLNCANGTKVGKWDGLPVTLIFQKNC